MKPWYILGVGAIGGLFASTLLRAGQPVRLVLRHSQLCDDYRQHGLVIETPNGCEQYTPLALSLDQPLPATAIQQLLVTTKAQQTATAVTGVTTALHPEATVVLLQNGMGVAEEIRPLLPERCQLLHATTTEGAWRRAPFHLVHAGRGLTRIGSTPTQLAMAQDIARHWTKAGLDCQAEADIQPYLWRKLAINCAINPFTALYQCRNGELPDQPDWQARCQQVLREILALATAEGYGSALTNIEDEVENVVRTTAANHSSMLQDIRAGRSTEINYLNGFIWRRCQQHALPCAENRTLTEAVLALSSSHPIP